MSHRWNYSMPRTMNLRDQKSYRQKYYKGYLRAFSESWIAQQDPETQARMRAHNEKVKVARAISRIQRQAEKERKDKERAALRAQRKAARDGRSRGQEAA
jgi:hypothetical protein